jgi:hyperosmotically inducible protein
MEAGMGTHRLSRILVLAVAVFAWTAVVARAADRPDGWITLKAKIALMTTEGISTRDLNVDTVNGVVTLHGQVPNDAQKTKAENVARGIDGAKQVKNLLQVVPKSERTVVNRADDQIQKDINAAFDANKRVHDSGIKVQSVNKGVVLLSGKTTSNEAYLEAIQVADAVRGVHRVSSEVQVTD